MNEHDASARRIGYDGNPNFILKSGFLKNNFIIILGIIGILLYFGNWMINSLANFANNYRGLPEQYNSNYYFGFIILIVVFCIPLLYLPIPLYSQLKSGDNFLKSTPEGLEYYDAPMLFDCWLPLPRGDFIPYISIVSVNLHQPGTFDLTKPEHSTLMSGGIDLILSLHNGSKIKLGKRSYKQRDIIQLALIIETEVKGDRNVAGFIEHSYPHQNPTKNSINYWKKILIKAVIGIGIFVIMSRL